MFDDFKELLSIFHDHGVKYVIVGGYAVREATESHGPQPAKGKRPPEPKSDPNS